MSGSPNPEAEITPAEVLRLYGLSQSADHIIAQIKAEALREAARDMRAQVERATEHQRFTEHELIEGGVEHVLNEYADRIEGSTK